MNGQTKVPLCSTGLRPLWGRCPKSSNEVKSERADFRPERADLSPKRTHSSSERANFRHDRADSRPKRVYFRHKRADFKSERADFRPERAWGDEVTNRSPKGNMWSAIPVALLCMIVIWSERKQGSGPEGDEVL